MSGYSDDYAVRTIQKPKVRSSSMPMLMVCTNSIMNPDGILPVENETETSLLGTIIHSLCQSIVDTGSFDLMSYKDRLNQEDFDRASMCVSNFMTAWRQASLYMKTPQTEVEFEVELAHVIVTGHIDNLQLDPARAFILDYKTGRMHEDHYHQMAAYAYGAWDKAGRPPIFNVFVTTIYLEDNSIQNYEWDVAGLLAWEREVSVQVLQLRYTAGRKCAFCPLQGGCPAYRSWGAGAVGIFSDDITVPAKTWEEMTPEERGDLVDKMYVIKKAIDRANLGLRNLVKSTGAVDVGDGKEYVLVEEEQKQVNSRIALPILTTYLGKEVVTNNTQLSLDAVLGAYSQRAARGQKTAARKELFEILEKAGAITRVKQTKMWRRPIGEKTLEA